MSSSTPLLPTGKATGKPTVVLQKGKEDDELNFDEDVLTTPPLKAKTAKEQPPAFSQPLNGTTNKATNKVDTPPLTLDSEAASNNEEEASLHFSEVESDDDDSAVPSVWGPAGTPESQQGASGIFGVSDNNFSLDRVGGGGEMMSWQSADPPHQLPIGMKETASASASLGQGGVVNNSERSNRSPRTATTKTFGDDPTHGTSSTSPPTSELSVQQLLRQQTQPHLQHNSTSGPEPTGPPLPAVNIYHLQPQHHYDPNMVQPQQAFPYLPQHTAYLPAAPFNGGPPRMFQPPAGHLMQSSLLGESVNGNGGSVQAVGHSHNSLPTGQINRNEFSIFQNEYERRRSVFSNSGGGKREDSRCGDSGMLTPPTLAIYPPLPTNNNNPSFVGGQQVAQGGGRPSSTRAEWSFSKRSEHNTTGNLQLSPGRGNRSTSAVQGSETFQTLASGVFTSVGGGYPTYVANSNNNNNNQLPDLTSPLPQFGSILSQPYTQYSNGGGGVDGGGIMVSPSQFGQHNINTVTIQSPLSGHLDGNSFRSDGRPSAIDNWGALSSPSHSLSLKRESSRPPSVIGTPNDARGGRPSPVARPESAEVSKERRSSVSKDTSAPSSKGTHTGSANTNTPSATAAAPATVANPGSSAVGSAVVEGEIKVCRHYLEGKCNRRKCRFLHPEGLAGSEAPTDQ